MLGPDAGLEGQLRRKIRRWIAGSDERALDEELLVLGAELQVEIGLGNVLLRLHAEITTREFSCDLWRGGRAGNVERHLAACLIGKANGFREEGMEAGKGELARLDVDGQRSRLFQQRLHVAGLFGDRDAGSAVEEDIVAVVPAEVFQDEELVFEKGIAGDFLRALGGGEAVDRDLLRPGVVDRAADLDRATAGLFPLNLVSASFPE